MILEKKHLILLTNYKYTTEVHVNASTTNLGAHPNTFERSIDRNRCCGNKVESFSQHLVLNVATPTVLALAVLMWESPELLTSLHAAAALFSSCMFIVSIFTGLLWRN